jgi:hypothetical protein
MAQETTDQHRFQYAARFLCTANIPGTSVTTPSVLPGNYQTTISIHNPHDQSVRFRRKIAAFSQVSEFIEDQLDSDRSTDVTCDSIARDFGPFIHGAEGFVVIESRHSLDVTAIYTAAKVGN